MKITAEHIEALSGVYLSPHYDQPQPTPPFHRECWALYCSAVSSAAIAAPRNHAKSTALTHDYILANVLFRSHDYVILISATEEMAIEHLGDIANELRENEALIADFKIKEFATDQKTDIIVECLDGHQFRILARGAEQKIRGRKWRGTRPGLIVCDDLEDDEQVESADRRKKLRNWFFRACKQALRDGGQIRVHGTILHEDSLLNRITRNKTWATRVYKAHAGFDDFTEILWPEKFPEERLRALRAELVAEGDAAGYSQEYLNDPFDNDEAYLRKDDFRPMEESDYQLFKRICVGVDFAVSKADKANRTSFTVGGEDAQDNFLHIIDQRSGRWDSLEIVDEFFSISARWNPEMFFVEDGVIWKSIWPVLKREMQKRNSYFAVTPILPVKDKAARGRALQKRHRAGGVRFDKTAQWYPAYEAIMLRFTGMGDAVQDDEFDSTAILARGLEDLAPVEDEDAISEEELEWQAESNFARSGGGGRNQVTGY